MREEMAVKLADVVFRRTELGTGSDPGPKALRDCAGIMADELDWDDNRTSEELEAVQSAFAGRGTV